jgi:probable phosphoglycerate mutase
MQLARALSSFPIGAVYCSPLARTSETAAPIAAAHGLAVRKDIRLREGAFGEWEGLSRAEVLARSSDDAELLARWECDPCHAPPGGESLLSVQARALELINELKTEGAVSCAVLVSHVGPIKALLAAALDVPLQSVRRFFLDPASISVLDWDEPPLLRLFNSHAHMGWRSARWLE